MSQPSLAVGSVFSGLGHNAQWLEMQLQALDRTTDGYDHFVYLNQADETIFQRSTIIGRGAERREATPSHLEGLHALRDEFRHRRYDRYLILDSDCFPVREGWIALLDQAMGRAGKRFASPARVENLHLFPHPCVLYTADPACLDFVVEEGVNFLGEKFTDIAAAGPREDWFPLIKTNRISPHQFLAAIYFDLFYHHGCGTRPFGMRPTTIQYYDHFWPRCDDATALFDRLMAERDQFVQSLR
ncbi:MAG: hypothetical protein ABI992_04635 [Chthoniobacterales bacterium]